MLGGPAPRPAPVPTSPVPGSRSCPRVSCSLVTVPFHCRLPFKVHTFNSPPSCPRRAYSSVTQKTTVVPRLSPLMAMQIGSMVHGSGREREVHDHHRRSQHFANQQQQLPQQHSPQHQQPTPYYSPQAQQHAYGSPTAQSPYPANPAPTDYQYQRPPQSPPSPPVEEQKPSLPSISSLLTIADNERAAAAAAAAETGNLALD